VNFSRIIRGSLEVSVRLALALPWPQVVAGGVACAALVAGGFFGLRPDLWLVERVEFSGASRIRSSELRHLLDLPNGTAMWQVEPGALEHALERHPWVRGATATVVWPATVHVDVVERSAVALLHDGERLLYVDQEGTPFLPARRAVARPRARRARSVVAARVRGHVLAHQRLRRRRPAVPAPVRPVKVIGVDGGGGNNAVNTMIAGTSPPEPHPSPGSSSSP
jgi:hypothetical protein